MELLASGPRYGGPPGSANGGYIAGLFAQHAPGTVRVRLHRPPPLGAPLQVAHREGGRLELLHDTRGGASAEPAQLELSAPAPPDYVEALEASRHYTGLV